MIDDPTIERFEARTDGQVVPMGGAVSHAPRKPGFRPGQSGNLLGRPRGSLSKMTMALAAQAADEIQRLQSEGKPASPLMGMIYVAMKMYDKIEKAEAAGEEVSLEWYKIFLAASEKLADRFAPVKSVIGVQIETPDSDEEQKMALEIGAVLARWKPRSEREALSAAERELNVTPIVPSADRL